MLFFQVFRSCWNPGLMLVYEIDKVRACEHYELVRILYKSSILFMVFRNWSATLRSRSAFTKRYRIGQSVDIHGLLESSYPMQLEQIWNGKKRKYKETFINWYSLELLIYAVLDRMQVNQVDVQKEKPVSFQLKISHGS